MPVWDSKNPGVWGSRIGSMGSDPSHGDEWTHCYRCARPTRMTGTRMCDACWERKRHAPEADDVLDALDSLYAACNATGCTDTIRIRYGTIMDGVEQVLRSVGRLA